MGFCKFPVSLSFACVVALAALVLPGIMPPAAEGAPVLAFKAAASTAEPSATEKPESSQAPTQAPKPGKALDGCEDDDYLTVPNVKSFQYTLNGKDVHGTIAFKEKDKLLAWYVKDGKKTGEPIEITRHAVGLTSTPCGEDGKPLPEQVAKQHTQKKWGIARVAVIAGSVLLIAAAGAGAVRLTRRQRYRHANN